MMIEQAASIVSAYVSNNRVQALDLPALLATVYAALIDIGQPARAAETSIERPSPAQIRRSITPDALVSFEDGKSYKILRRHLGRLGFTPDTYRQKWGLPADYPMVAANYAEARSALAKSSGLSSMRKAAASKQDEADGALI